MYSEWDIMHKQIKSILLPPYLAAIRLYNEDYSYQASALSFITVVSIIPFMAVVLYLFSFFSEFNDFIIFFENYIYTNFLPEVAVSVKDYLNQFAFHAQKLPLTSIIFSCIAAVTMLLTIENTFTAICRTCVEPKNVFGRAMSWAIVLLIIFFVGIFAFISVSVISLYALNESQFFILQILNYLINTTLLASFYVYIPHGDITWRSGLIGGATSAFLFEVGTKTFGSYIIYLTNYNNIYGTLALIPIFLLWIYVSWLIVLYGALLICQKNHEPVNGNRC